MYAILKKFLEDNPSEPVSINSRDDMFRKIICSGDRKYVRRLITHENIIDDNNLGFTVFYDEFEKELTLNFESFPLQAPSPDILEMLTLKCPSDPQQIKRFYFSANECQTVELDYNIQTPLFNKPEYFIPLKTGVQNTFSIKIDDVDEDYNLEMVVGYIKTLNARDISNELSYEQEEFFPITDDHLFYISTYDWTYNLFYSDDLYCRRRMFDRYYKTYTDEFFEENKFKMPLKGMDFFEE
jgi:hypothetical protein